MNQKIENVYEWLKARERKLLLWALIFGTVLTVIAAGAMTLAHRAQESLAEAVVRFHVLGNSDSEEDQALKMQVKESVIAYLEKELRSVKTRQEAEELLQQNLRRIQQVAARTVEAAGSDQTVTVSLADSDFPTKRYGSVMLPAGTYRALRIELGDARGANWWCMLFPALCFVDEEAESLPEETEEQMDEALTEEDSELIHQDEAGPFLRFKFKLIEWWAAIFG